MELLMNSISTHSGGFKLSAGKSMNKLENWGFGKSSAKKPPQKTTNIYDSFNLENSQMDLHADSGAGTSLGKSSNEEDQSNVTMTIPTAELEFPFAIHGGKEFIAFYDIAEMDLEKILEIDEIDVELKNSIGYDPLQWKLILCKRAYVEETSQEILCKVLSAAATSSGLKKEEDSEISSTLKDFFFNPSYKSIKKEEFTLLANVWTIFNNKKKNFLGNRRKEKAAFLLKCTSLPFQYGSCTFRLAFGNNMDLPTIADALEVAACVVEREARMETLMEMIQAAGSFDLLIEEEDVALGPLATGGFPLISMILAPERKIEDNMTLAKSLISCLSPIRDDTKTKRKVMTAAGWLMSEGKHETIETMINALPSIALSIEDMKNLVIKPKETKMAFFEVQQNITRFTGANFIMSESAIGPSQLISILEDSTKLLFKENQIGIIENAQDKRAADSIQFAIRSLSDNSLTRYREGPGEHNNTAINNLLKHKERLRLTIPLMTPFTYVLATGLPHSLIKEGQKLREVLKGIFDIECWAGISDLDIENTVNDLEHTAIDLGGSRYGVLVKSGNPDTASLPLIMGYTGNEKGNQKFKHLLHPLSDKQGESLLQRKYQVMSVWRNLGTSSSNILSAKTLIDEFLKKTLRSNPLSIVHLLVHGVPLPDKPTTPLPPAKAQSAPMEAKRKYAKVEEYCLIVFSASLQQANIARNLMGFGTPPKMLIIEIGSWKFETHPTIDSFSNTRFADPDLMKTRMNIMVIEGHAALSVEAAMDVFGKIADLDCYRLIIPPLPSWEWEQFNWSAIMIDSWTYNSISNETLEALRATNISVSFKDTLHKYVQSSQLFNGQTKLSRPPPTRVYDHWFELAEQKAQHRQKANRPMITENITMPTTMAATTKTTSSYAKALTTNSLDLTQVVKLVEKLEENTSLVGKLVSENQAMNKKVEELGVRVSSLQRQNRALSREEECDNFSKIQDLVLNTIDTKLQYMANKSAGITTDSPPHKRDKTEE